MNTNAAQAEDKYRRCVMALHTHTEALARYNIVDDPKVCASLIALVEASIIATTHSFTQMMNAVREEERRNADQIRLPLAPDGDDVLP